MSTEVSKQLDRIEGAVADIKTAIENQGVPVYKTAKIDDLAGLISNITKEDGKIYALSKFNTTTGVFTAEARVSTAGYVETSDTASVTYDLTTQAAKTVTPTTSDLTAVESGMYTTGAITVKGDANLIAGNIKKGVSIFGVTGTHEGGASIATCNITVTISDSVGYIGVTATTFAEGAVGTFAQNKSSGTFTINNVVCGSIISVICNGYFSISTSMTQSTVGSTSIYLKAPSATGSYTAQIIAYDD